MGADSAARFHDFDANCRDQDVAELLEMIYSMTAQGCIADVDAAAAAAEAVLSQSTSEDAETEGVTEQLGLHGAANHFATELGVCQWDEVDAKIAAVDQACCNERDADNLCRNGVPTICDIEVGSDMTGLGKRSILQSRSC